ncbi:uncharacterized protein LOC129587782 isoform X1 [Paramacrobiotus metropolitanus]|uniref:uncharacterized protein LOC129587782 isoform X1 n=1 Tax=Paramacrobiotus metropolitanus TaxID=2943436 RepID=UPI0024464578|nr:uncharacterized protein LOC129587782 isoform X1 [Paramacrobiotus metropolitanus]
MESISVSPADIDYLYVVDRTCTEDASTTDGNQETAEYSPTCSTAALSLCLGKNLKLQVVKHKRRLYALNSAHLSMIKRSYSLGSCAVVPVTVIPSSLVPEAVIRLLDGINSHHDAIINKHTDEETASKGIRQSSKPSPRATTTQRKTDGPNAKVTLYDELEEDVLDAEESAQVYEWEPNDIEDEEESIESNGDEDTILCAVCEQVFETKQDLNNHRAKKRHYFCSLCEDIFFNPAQLQLHKTKTEHFSDDEGDDVDDNHAYGTEYQLRTSNKNQMIAVESEIESLL